MLFYKNTEIYLAKPNQSLNPAIILFQSSQPPKNLTNRKFFFSLK